MLLLVIALLSFSTTWADKGSCPPTLPVDISDATCGTHAPCVQPQLCCPTVNGGSLCVDPVTQRHFVTLVKSGRCPEEPKGPWICSDTCTSDSDCPRALKCCPNRCGVLACQKPDAEQENGLKEIR